jgi:hypothetical protein
MQLKAGCDGVFSPLLFIHRGRHLSNRSARRRRPGSRAGSTQKAATITVESNDEGVAGIVEAVGEFWRLTEPALKGFAFEVNGRAQDDPVWSGIAVAAERRREILRRYRTGKGVWYAVIEGVRSERGSNTGEIFTIDHERCDSLKAAEAAARRLLVKNAGHFSELIGVEPHVYSELEWVPPK